MEKAKNIAKGSWVTVIDPKANIPHNLRVAAYARVSTDSEDQVNSYIAQVDHYTKYIRDHAGWDLVEVYADEGLTGMSTQHREDFNRMINDCRAGKIDRILVKSISRFARNQQDFILHMRELLKCGVSIYFEKENLDTGKMNSEQVADIYGAFAQMETTGHAQNMRMSYHIQMEKGIFVPAKPPYGYRLEKRQLIIVPEEAAVVKYIFQEYLAGRGKQDLAQELNERGIKRSKGSGAWHFETIGYILSNPTYTGNQIWQKTYKTDVLPYEERRNKGERPKYYAEDCCPAIISQADFDQVQLLISKRKESSQQTHSASPLPGRLVFCAECGSSCRRKAQKNRVSWSCRKHERSKAECPSKRVEEQELLDLLRRFYHKMRMHGDSILKPLLLQLTELQEIELRSNPQIGEIDSEIARLAEQNHVLTRLKTKGFMDTALFLSEQNGINSRVRELKRKRKDILNGSKQEAIIHETEEMLQYLENGPEWLQDITVDALDHLIDRILLAADNRVRIRMKNGLEVIEQLEGGPA